MAIAILLGSFLVLLFAGVPVAVAMLAASIIDLIYLNLTGLPLPPVVVAERILSSINSFPVLAVPFFILAGVIMNRGGLTGQLVNVARAFVGHFHGGTAQVNVLASILFSGISGSASADAAAIGSMLIPAMKREGYPAGFAVGITAASATIGPIIPPSIVMIIYATMTNLSIGALFIAGILPGLAIGIALMVMVAIMSRREGYPRQARTPWGERWRIMLRAIPALIAPVIIVGGIVTGLYTATEAGVVACVYGVVVGLLVYRELRLSDLSGLLAEAVETTAIPVFILACASIFGWLLTFHGFGPVIVGTFQALDLSPTMMMLTIVGLLLVIGLVIEGLAALIIFVPVFMPLIPAFGFDPIHFALVVIVTILIGTVTPPVGLQLYIASAIGQTRLQDVVVWPFVFAMVIVVILMVLIEPMATFLPALLMGS
jgi:tripartite ATP-independent transporter DctM subunit